MNRLYINRVGLAADGLPDWQQAQPVLRGERAYECSRLALKKTVLLPANEARRAGARVRLAFQAAEPACAGLDVTALPTVFASEVADTRITDRICRDIIDPARAVSPTQFHNSVHNTASGYWSIATGSQAAANSLSGGCDSFCVALRECQALLATGECEAVLLVCFESLGADDNALDRARPCIYGSFATALHLSARRVTPQATAINLAATNRPATLMRDAELEKFRAANPAARSLPLLAGLADLSAPDDGNTASPIVLASSQGNLGVGFEAD